MSGVFESYEQQFATITADITARIGRIPNHTGSKYISLYVWVFTHVSVDVLINLVFRI